MSTEVDVDLASPGLTDCDDALAEGWHLLMGRYSQLTCKLDRELSGACDLTSSDFNVLEQLTLADCGLRMHELGERVHLSQSALSRLIARLERDGLVERTMCTTDRRSVITRLTAEGAGRYTRAKPVHRAVLRSEAAHLIDDKIDSVCDTTRTFGANAQA